MERPDHASHDDLRPQGNRPARGARVVTPGELVDGALRQGAANGDFLGLGASTHDDLLEIARDLESGAHTETAPPAPPPFAIAEPPAVDIYASTPVGAVEALEVESADETYEAGDDEGECIEFETALGEDGEEAHGAPPLEVESSFGESEESFEDAHEVEAEHEAFEEETGESDIEEVEEAVAEFDEEGSGEEDASLVLPLAPKRRRSRAGAFAAVAGCVLLLGSAAVVFVESPAGVERRVRGLLDSMSGEPKVAVVDGPTSTPVASRPAGPKSAPARVAPPIVESDEPSAPADVPPAVPPVAMPTAPTPAVEPREERPAPAAEPEPAVAAAVEAERPAARETPPAPPAREVEKPAPVAVLPKQPVAPPVAPEPERAVRASTEERPTAVVSLAPPVTVPAAPVAVEPPPIPGNLRLATADELGSRWPNETVPPMSVADRSEPLLTPLVGRVRVLTRTGQTFDGRMHSIGAGQVTIESHLGRMSLAARTIERIDRLPGINAPARGAEVPAGERVRVRTPGGLIHGRIVSRDGNRVTILTDAGGRVTLVDPEIEPADQRLPGGVLPKTGGG